MKFIDFMLSDDEILKEYKKIDEVNPYPSNHGMKHVFGVLSLVDSIAPLFNLSDREILILKTCEILHDIGQVQGRKDHGLRSAEFAKNYLPPKNIFSKAELEMIYSAIATHDEFLDYSKFENKYSWFVAFIDKLDFSKSRLEDDYLERYDYVNSSDIERLDFILKENDFVIIIKTIKYPKIIAPENLYNRNLICKAMTLFEVFSNHFGYNARLFLENEELDINKFNKDMMVDR